MRPKSFKIDRYGKKALFGIFALSRNCCIDQNQRFVIWVSLRKRKLFDGDLGWSNHPSSYWEIRVWLAIRIKDVRFFLNFLTMGIMMEGWETLVLQSNHPPQDQALHRYFWGMNQANSCWEIGVYILTKVIICLWPSGTWCKEQNWYFSNGTVQHKWKTSKWDAE